jgi:hypothetical protein
MDREMVDMFLKNLVVTFIPRKHDNFFEKRVTEYSVNGMEGDWGWEEVAA